MSAISPKEDMISSRLACLLCAGDFSNTTANKRDRTGVHTALSLRRTCRDRPPCAHELEGVDDLLAERMHVDYAGTFVGKFVFVQCRNRIAKHQRVNDPDGGRLHCEKPPCQRVSRNGRHELSTPIVTESLIEHLACAARVHRKTTFCTGCVSQRLRRRSLRITGTRTGWLFKLPKYNNREI